MCHKLNVNPNFSPRHQKCWELIADRREAVATKVAKLLSVGYIREVQYPQWLANPMPVKKVNGKWGMCVDFTNLNKACPKDRYPLPSFDELIDGVSRNEILSLLSFACFCWSSYPRTARRLRSESLCLNLFMGVLARLGPPPSILNWGVHPNKGYLPKLWCKLGLYNPRVSPFFSFDGRGHD